MWKVRSGWAWWMARDFSSRSGDQGQGHNNVGRVDIIFILSEFISRLYWLFKVFFTKYFRWRFAVSPLCLVHCVKMYPLIFIWCSGVYNTWVLYTEIIDSLGVWQLEDTFFLFVCGKMLFGFQNGIMFTLKLFLSVKLSQAPIQLLSSSIFAMQVFLSGVFKK